MPDDARDPTLALAELEQLVIELDQVKAELELERNEAKRWRTVANLLGARIREVAKQAEIDLAAGSTPDNAHCQG